MRIIAPARLFLIATTSIYLAGCAGASVMQLNANTIQVSVEAAPVCGATGAQNVAYKRAAVETIRHGFDNFVILNGQAQNNVGVAMMPPTQANTYGSGTLTGGPGMVNYSGQSTTTYSGGGPMFYGSHDQSLVVRMFKDGDPAGQNSISARMALGEKWQEEVASKGNTCL